MSDLIWVVCGAAILYAAVAVGMFVGQRSLLYRPNAMPLEDRPVDLPPPEEIDQRAADGGVTRSWYWSARLPGLPTLVFYHGNAGHIGNRRDKIEAYVKAGLGVMLVGYRGFGGNAGQPTEQGLYADGRAALDVLRERGVDVADIVVYGESLGSGVAVQMATEHRFGAVVLEAPISSVVDVAQGRYWFLPVDRLVIDRFDNTAKIDRIGAPLLLMHGPDDRVVPFRLGQRLFDAAADPKQLAVFDGAGHNDLYDHGAAMTVLTFLAGCGMMPAVADTAETEAAR